MGHPGPPHPGPAEEEPAGSRQPGSLGLSTELAGCLVAGGTVRILQQLLPGSFAKGMSGELYSLMQEDQEVSLLGGPSRRCREVVPPALMSALLVVHDMLEGGNRVGGGVGR